MGVVTGLQKWLPTILPLPVGSDSRDGEPLCSLDWVWVGLVTCFCSTERSTINILGLSSPGLKRASSFYFSSRQLAASWKCDCRWEERSEAIMVSWAQLTSQLNATVWLRVLVTQSRLTLCDPVDCRPSGSSVHGISQARILEWAATPFSRGSSQPRDWTWVSCIAGRFFTIWATREVWLEPWQKNSRETQPPHRIRRNNTSVLLSLGSLVGDNRFVKQWVTKDIKWLKVSPIHCSPVTICVSTGIL